MLKFFSTDAPANAEPLGSQEFQEAVFVKGTVEFAASEWSGSTLKKRRKKNRDFCKLKFNEK